MADVSRQKAEPQKKRLQADKATDKTRQMHENTLRLVVLLFSCSMPWLGKTPHQAWQACNA